jgi:ABC-type multidrug transport system permease subunit
MKSWFRPALNFTTVFCILLNWTKIGNLQTSIKELILRNNPTILNSILKFISGVPSEYGYHINSVSRNESASANCRRYPATSCDLGIISIHCDGDQLKLSDSDRGSNMEYTATSYYVWSAGSAEQLLFILPTRVSLTTITLHYYSDSDRGVPD